MQLIMINCYMYMCNLKKIKEKEKEEKTFRRHRIIAKKTWGE